MDYIVQGILQARTLEWVAFPSPEDLPNLGIKPWSPTLLADSSPAEPQGKPKNTGVRSLSLLQGILPIQGLNPGLQYCRQILHQLSYQESPVKQDVRVVMYGCESWTVKKAEHRRIDAFELWCWRRLLKVPWTARRANQSILKKIKSWVFTGRTDAEAETPVLWSPHVKSWLIGKDPDAGRNWGQEEKGMTEDEMAGWHHRLEGHEFE